MTTRCPTCSFAVPDGAPRCPQCGRVFGEVNRCPHCHAVASVRPSGDGFVCTACGKPRKLEPGTTVIGTDATSLTTPRRRGLRVLGGLSMALAVLGAATATTLLGTGAVGLAAAAAVAIVCASIGVRLLRRANAHERVIDEHLTRSREEQARQILVERSSTIPELAKELGTSEAEADAIATKLAAGEVDGIRAELDEKEGVLRFGRTSAAAVRVADPDASRSDDDEASDDASSDEARAREKEREAR